MKAAIVLALGLLVSAPASAAIRDFSGMRENVNPSTVPGSGRCVPPYFSTAIFDPDLFISRGTSTLGSFDFSASHCAVGPAPSDIVDGIAEMVFESGDLMFATYTGFTTLGDGFLNSETFWTITGGTGRFLHASGLVHHIGTVRGGMYEGVRVGFYEGSFRGQLNLPAIPEPASWAMMILGFGLVGAVARRRPARVTA